MIRDLASLLDRAEALLRTDGRRLLGITGPPGAGKSTLANWLERTLNGLQTGPELVAQLPMDGFHFRNAILAQRGLTDWKGAPQTFDVDAYVQLLRDAREKVEETLFAPMYSREIHEPVPNAHKIPSSVRLVITEGNYLLLPEGRWSDVRALLDEVWFVAADREICRERLVKRQRAGGRTMDAAEEWVNRSDMKNVDLVNLTRDHADVQIELLGMK